MSSMFTSKEFSPLKQQQLVSADGSKKSPIELPLLANQWSLSSAKTTTHTSDERKLQKLPATTSLNERYFLPIF